MKYMSESEKKTAREESDADFAKQEEWEKVHGNEIFTWASLVDGIESCAGGKNSIFYSWTTWWDNVTIVLTLACGIFTLGLFIQTIDYVRK